jgi:hypothetical protein
VLDKLILKRLLIPKSYFTLLDEEDTMSPTTYPYFGAALTAWRVGEKAGQVPVFSYLQVRQ